MNNFTASNCLTVKELKDLIKDWPEKYENGDETLVFINWPDKNCGIVSQVTKLNVKLDSDGNEIAGILLSTIF